MGSASVRLAVAVAAAGLILAGGSAGVRRARANGAFPDALGVLLPRDRPQEIILATTFGLVSSSDDGKTWLFSCESDATSGGYRYSVGPPAAGGVSGDRLFAVSSPLPGAPVSVDDACTWTLSGGAIAAAATAAYATDVFPDPSNPARVFLLASPQGADPPSGSVYRSLDGGVSYAGPVYTPVGDGGVVMAGVEVSASSAGTVYASWYERTGFRPHLSRSRDGGDTWIDLPLEAQLGAVKPYLAAVDPADPDVVFLRLIAPASEALAVTRDGGATWTLPVTIPGGSFQALVRRQDGSAIALGVPAATTSALSRSTLYRSTDGGRTFAPEPLDYHSKGLAERDGTLFMATDNAIDLVALVSSTDGTTWKSRLRFEDISAIRGCVFASCRSPCDFVLGKGPIFSPEVCSRSSDATGGRAGSGGMGGAAGGGTGGSGCGCAIGPPGAGAAGLVGGGAGGLLSGALGLLLVIRRGRPPARSPSRSPAPARVPARDGQLPRRAGRNPG